VIIGLDTLHAFEYSMFERRTDISREVFLATGRARDLLVEAFSKLPNLRCVGLRDYEGHGRYREGMSAKWKSYGWSLRDNVTHHRGKYAPPDTILPLLLYALSKASIAPTNLETFLRRARLPDCSFDLSCLPPDVAPVLSGLRALLLSLDDEQSIHGAQVNTAHRHLKNFLQRTPFLEHLRCNFSQNATGSDSFLRWLGTPSGVTNKAEPPPITLDHLTTLDLGNLCMKPDTLLQVVAKVPNLKALSLWKVVLLNTEVRGSGVPSSTGRVWSDCLPKLGKAFQAPKGVNKVMIGYAVERSDTLQHYISDMKFAGKMTIDQNDGKKFEDPEPQVSYRKRVGSSVQDWFEDIGSKVFGDSPIYPNGRSDDSEDGEDDDGEDDDGEDDDDEDDDDDDEGDVEEVEV
jgi:hypothetical protein